MTSVEERKIISNAANKNRMKQSSTNDLQQTVEAQSNLNIDGIREFTKPLFSIQTHAFLFNAGNIDAKFYIDSLQLEQSEDSLIRYPQRGVRLAPVPPPIQAAASTSM